MSKFILDKRRVILIFVLMAIVGAIYYLESTSIGPTQTTDVQTTSTRTDKPVLKEGMYPLAPELTGIAGYLNTNGTNLTIASLEGKVVLVDFWTYTCINCIRTLPYITAWDTKYGNKGLVIIGVHTPEFGFEKKKENVQASLERYGIHYPVVQDNDYGTWQAFDNHYWPAKYLIDADGYIRYTHFGEGNYEETEAEIQKLLTEAGQSTTGVALTQENTTEHHPTTPEIYAGALFALQRNQFVGNKKTATRLENYTMPATLTQANTIYLDGAWEYGADELTAKSTHTVLALAFTAREANIVASAPSPLRVEVLIDGSTVKRAEAGTDVVFDASGKGFMTVSDARLYNFYTGTYDLHRVDFVTQHAGFMVNSFTFGG